MKTLEASTLSKPSPKTGRKPKLTRREFFYPSPIIITKDDVESGNTNAVFAGFESLGIYTPNQADVNLLSWLQSKVSILIAGYEDDPRELSQIPEVRAFWQALHKAWPYGLYFFDRDSGTLLNCFMSHMTLNVTPEGEPSKIQMTVSDPEEVKKFLFSNGTPLVEMTRRMGWSAAEAGKYLGGIPRKLTNVPDAHSQLKFQLALMMRPQEVPEFFPVPVKSPLNGLEFETPDKLTQIQINQQADGKSAGTVQVAPESPESRLTRQLAFLKTGYGIFAAVAWLCFTSGGRGALIFRRMNGNSAKFRYAIEFQNLASLLQDASFSQYEALTQRVQNYNPQSHFLACVCEPGECSSVEMGIAEVPPPVAFADMNTSSDMFPLPESEDE